MGKRVKLWTKTTFGSPSIGFYIYMLYLINYKVVTEFQAKCSQNDFSHAQCMIWTC